MHSSHLVERQLKGRDRKGGGHNQMEMSGGDELSIWSAKVSYKWSLSNS